MTRRLTRDERSDVRWWARYGARWAVAAVIAIVLLVAVLAVGWQRYVSRARLDADARNRRSSFERQETDRRTLTRKLSEWSAVDPTDTAHRAILRDEICAIIDGIRGQITPTQANWADNNC